MSFKDLVIGDLYSKKDLSIIFDNSNIKIIREGIYNLSQTETFFFVDLEKKGKEQRFHFDDFFEGDYFHWDSQTTQHINTPKDATVDAAAAHQTGQTGQTGQKQEAFCRLIFAF